MSNGYWALRHHAAVLDLSDRGKIRLSGEDRARLLHAMTTNQVEQLTPGTGCYAFFLNAQGRILGDASLFCFDGYFLMDTEPETREKLFQHLDRYIIADDVTLEDITPKPDGGGLATIAVEGPEAFATLAKLRAPVPDTLYATRSWGEITVARVSSTGGEGVFLFAPAALKEQLIAELSALGVIAATADDARTVRIENGHPRYGEEITERYLVHETGQLHAVNFNKGCYLGQEIVERVRSRGQVHRVLKRLELETSVPPASGAKLKSGDADAGEIASAVFSPALEKVVALAYVRTPHADVGTELQLEGTPARVTL